SGVERLWQLDFALPKRLFWVLTYVCFLTVVYYLFSNDPRGANLLTRTCAFALLALILASLIWIVDYRDETLLKNAISISFLVTVLGVVVGDFNLLHLAPLVANPVLHYTAITD